MWLQKHGWLIGLFISILVALFPNAFVAIGVYIQMVILNYWLPMSIVVIIALLIALIIMVKKTST